MDLSIVIVNYNSKDKTFFCLNSIYKSNLNGISFEVIVVDNDSSEKIEEELKNKYPSVVFIQSDENLGMGSGNNLGIKNSTGKYILILNPDTEVRPNTIKKLYDYANNDKNIGLIGPKLFYPDGKIQNSCYHFPNLLIPFFRRTFLSKFAKGYLDYYLMKNTDLSKPLEVDWIMGSCLLVRRSLLDKIGLFDERFFMYFEDTDLCRRIKLSGWKVIYLPSAEVIHHHGRASAKRHWLIAPFTNRLSRVHIASWIKYFLKWRFK